MTKKRQMRSPLAMLSLLAIAGCEIEGAAPEGAVLYRQNCSDCHGRTGAGDGPKGRALAVAPADLRVLSAQNDGVFPADRVITTIYGYSGKDHFGLMPGFGSVLQGPTTLWTTSDAETIPTPTAIIALTDYIATLQAP
jgi:mono/diheme cytochrome c family protein